jgi:hypothetical protein
MSAQSHSLLGVTVVAAGALTAHRFVVLATGLQAGAAVAGVGVTDSNAAIGEAVHAHVIGTAQVEAGAAIAAGALVESDASGRAVTRSAGATLGRLAPREVAAAAGDKVEIILFQN